MHLGIYCIYTHKSFHHSSFSTTFLLESIVFSITQDFSCLYRYSLRWKCLSRYRAESAKSTIIVSFLAAYGLRLLPTRCNVLMRDLLGVASINASIGGRSKPSSNTDVDIKHLIVPSLNLLINVSLSGFTEYIKLCPPSEANFFPCGIRLTKISTRLPCFIKSLV